MGQPVAHCGALPKRATGIEFALHALGEYVVYLVEVVELVRRKFDLVDQAEDEVLAVGHPVEVRPVREVLVLSEVLDGPEGVGYLVDDVVRVVLRPAVLVRFAREWMSAFPILFFR